MGYISKVISVTPTITAGAYSAGDALGGRMEFTPAKYLGGGTIQSVTVIDKASAAAEIDLVFFDQTFTATTDNSAFDPTDADLANCIGVVTILPTDYASFTDNSVASAVAGLVYKADDTSGFSLWCQMVVRTTPTYAATTDLIVKVGLVLDR